MKVALYLRKSRADEEAEQKGEYETLSRHRSTLLKVAKEQNLNIVEIKEEVVSGESVHYRPKMLELLEEVKNGMYDAVLVMDIDRLGRGNMSDQGLILETFKQSKTKIITPRKIYDLSNEWDEEYSEFEAFMARKELKLITRRMQRGRIKSVEEGKYLASSAPIGYKFEYEGKNRLLVIDNDKSEIVKLIFDMYLEGSGSYKIAHHLNLLGYRTNTDNTFKEKAIRDIIKNKTYAGYVVWNKVERKRNSSRTRDESEQVEAKGLHEAIIDLELWNKAQTIRKKRIISPVADNKKMTNPFAGLVACRECGCMMSCGSSTYKNEGYIKFLTCKQCKGNRGVKLYVFEQEILSFLRNFLNMNMDTITSRTVNEDKENLKSQNNVKILNNLEKESSTLIIQKEKLHDLLERGIYDIDTYLDRSKTLTDKIEENKKAISGMKESISKDNKFNTPFNKIIPEIENVLINYDNAPDAATKNKLLKGIIDSIVYYKPSGKRLAKFEIDVKLKSEY